jgi:hypothetical protein
MKKVPSLRSENEEREFWSKAGSTGYIDWKGTKRVTFSKLKPSLRTISLRLPEMMIELKLCSFSLNRSGFVVKHENLDFSCFHPVPLDFGISL